MITDLHAQIMAEINALFDVPVIQNNLRGLYAEYLVAALLDTGWKVTSSDWGACDIKHKDGTLVEVKQSAAKQTWQPSVRGYSAPRFSIKTPKWLWEGAVATPANGRPAHLYVFAWHGDYTETADHRDPSKWCFFVVPTAELPDQQSIGLSSLRKLTDPVSSEALGAIIERHRIQRNLQ